MNGITLRKNLDRPLTHEEMDNNFVNGDSISLMAKKLGWKTKTVSKTLEPNEELYVHEQFGQEELENIYTWTYTVTTINPYTKVAYVYDSWDWVYYKTLGLGHTATSAYGIDDLMRNIESDGVNKVVNEFDVAVEVVLDIHYLERRAIPNDVVFYALDNGKTYQYTDVKEVDSISMSQDRFVALFAYEYNANASAKLDWINNSELIFAKGDSEQTTRVVTRDLKVWEIDENANSLVHYGDIVAGKLPFELLRIVDSSGSYIESVAIIHSNLGKTKQNYNIVFPPDNIATYKAYDPSFSNEIGTVNDLGQIIVSSGEVLATVNLDNYTVVAEHEGETFVWTLVFDGGGGYFLVKDDAGVVQMMIVHHEVTPNV